MRNRTFASSQHAHEYLSKSVIQVDGEPVFVHGVADGVLTYYPLPTESSKHSSIRLDDPLIDLNPIPLGFLPIPESTAYSAGYVKRGPYRQWKIGLTSHNCMAAKAFEQATTVLPVHHFLCSKMMVDLAKGRYPDPKKAQVMSEANNNVIGFSRRFAVMQSHLLFKDLCEPVGEVLKGKPMLHEDFTYLTRMLNEDMNASGNC